MSGIRVDLFSPAPEQIKIEDIAHALSNICRFNGHISEFYSVAQHSVMVAEILPQELKFVGLLHDSTEAYMCDIPRPIKGHLTNYAEYEAQLYRALAKKFGLPDKLPPEVKWADNVALMTEAKLVGDTSRWEDFGVKPLDIVPTPWTPHEARDRFLAMYHEYSVEP